MEEKRQIVDVAINAYGKPYQTAVALFSLLKHSGKWINKIYFVIEKRQPEPLNYQFILDELGDKVVCYKPKFWFWYNKIFPMFLRFRHYRYSIRYQYAWEKSDRDYLLLMHNDVYFKSDLIGEYLARIDGYTAIGQIGQCWNCPALTARLCDSDSYMNYRPDYQELMALSAKYPGPRSYLYEKEINKNVPWPLPECRVNEYVSLINLALAKKDTIPVGRAMPVGSNNRLDTGVEWFSDLNNKGHRFANFDYNPFATHSWVSLKNAGHAALFDKDLYKYEESVALELLKSEFGL